MEAVAVGGNDGRPGRATKPWTRLAASSLRRPVLTLQVGNEELPSVGGYCLTLCDELLRLNISLGLPPFLAALQSHPS